MHNILQSGVSLQANQSTAIELQVIAHALECVGHSCPPEIATNVAQARQHVIEAMAGFFSPVTLRDKELNGQKIGGRQ